MANINNNHELRSLNNPPQITQTSTPGGDSSIPTNQVNTQQTGTPYVRAQDLQRRSSHPNLRAMTETESIYPQGTPRPPRVQELVSAVIANDRTALSDLGTSLVNGNETCTSAAIGPLLSYAINKNKSLQVKAALAQMPGTQPSELLQVAVRGNDLELARFLLQQGAQPDLAAIDGHTSANMRELLYATDKINRLYADNANYTEYAAKYTPLDQALQRYDLNETRRQFGDIKAYVEQSTNNGQPLSELDFWLRANKAPDIQRAMLALMPEVIQQLSESQPVVIQNGVQYKLPQTLLHYSKMNDGTDPRVRNELIKYGYYSEKPGAGTGTPLNGVGIFATTNLPITCAPLSWLWLKGIATSQTGKPDYNTLKDKASIEHHMPADVISRRNALWACAAEVHRVRTENWGAFVSSKLQSMDRPMQNGEVVQQLMLINAPLHQMAAEFKIKVENGEKKYVIKLYDPNRTDSHKRIRANDITTIEATTISSLLENKSLEPIYYGDSCQHLMVHVVSENENWEPIENRILPQYGDTGRRLTSNDGAIDSAAVMDILWYGFDGELKKLKDEIKAMDPNDAIRLLSPEMELLTVYSKVKAPGFHLALQNGHTATVKAFMEIVNELDIPDEEKIRLLRGEAENASGSLVAVRLNRLNTIAAYFEGLNQLKLKDEGKREEAILRLVGDNRPSDVYWTIGYALANNHAGTIEAYIQGVGQLNISDEKKKELILGTAPDGTSAFSQLAREDKLTPDTIKTYLKCVSEIALPDPMKQDLLAARSKSGLSAYEIMEIAMNKTGCKAYIEGVKALDIPVAMKKALLPKKEHAGIR